VGCAWCEGLSGSYHSALCRRFRIGTGRGGDGVVHGFAGEAHELFATFVLTVLMAQHLGFQAERATGRLRQAAADLGR
jgi:hypothetical protein